MLGNVLDRRTDPRAWDIDAVFEPAAHSSPDRFDYEKAATARTYFYVTALVGTTVREALLYAESAWPFEVTVFLYDVGSRPLG